MNTETLHKIFDINDKTADYLPNQHRIMLTKNTEEEEQTDLDEAKYNIKSMIKASSIALEELINISIESQSSKHFDSLANLLKALNESNRYLVDINLDQNKLLEKTSSSITNHNTQINNTVFVGSTTELQKLIRENTSS